MNKHVAVYSAKPYEVKALNEANTFGFQLQFLEERLSAATVHLAENCEAISIFSNDEASAEVLELLKEKGVKFIALRSAGFDHVDTTACKQLGIAVANVPEYSPFAIAEHSIMLMMALNRKLLAAQKLIQQNNYALDELVGFDINGKTVGVIGTGKIGAAAIKILHGFGCKILAYDIAPNQQLTSKFQVQYVSLDELYAASDIISIYCPATPATKYLINESSIAKMKRGVMLINTARGSIVHTQHLIEALENRTIGYCGLDVYENEKGLFFYDHSNAVLQDEMLKKLLQLNNVIITGHQAFLTATALKNIADTTLMNIEKFLSTGEVPNAVT